MRLLEGAHSGLKDNPLGRGVSTSVSERNPGVARTTLTFGRPWTEAFIGDQFDHFGVCCLIAGQIEHFGRGGIFGVTQPGTAGGGLLAFVKVLADFEVQLLFGSAVILVGGWSPVSLWPS